MDTINKIENLKNINNGLGFLTDEIKEKINTIDDTFSKYSNSNCDDKKSHNERILQSQFNCFVINSKALRDSIDEIQNNINKVIKEMELV